MEIPKELAKKLKKFMDEKECQDNDKIFHSLSKEERESNK